MILTKFVKLRIRPIVLKHYLSLGYNIKVNDIAEILVEHLTDGSHVLIWVQCDECGGTKQIQYNKYLSNTKNNIRKYTCSEQCSHNSNKIKETKKELYGDDNYHNIGQMKQTNLERYGDENYNNTNKNKQTKLLNHGNENYNNRDKFKETMLENWGVEHPMYCEEIIRKRIETQTRMLYDDYIEKLPDFKKYEREVLKFTKKQSLSLLKDIEKRSPYDYHLDHMFSITEGFRQNISPHIIGDIVNLEMLPWRENQAKYNKSTMIDSKLFERYDNRDSLLKQLTEDYNKRQNSTILSF